MQTVEQVVLKLLEALDLGCYFGPAPLHGLGVAGCLAVLLLGERCLRDQRAQARIVGFGDEVRDLLIVNRQICP